MKSCILLCGGRSRRMGQDKGSMIINEKPMIIHILSALNDVIDEVVIVLNDENRIRKYMDIVENEKYSYPIIFVEDEIKNKGPLSGIMTGLKNIKSRQALVIPCDSPFISKNHVEAIFEQCSDEFDCIVPYHDDSDRLKTSEPLHSIYKKTNLQKIEKLLAEDRLAIKNLIENVNCKFIKIDDKKLLKKEFRNLNSPQDI